MAKKQLSRKDLRRVAIMARVREQERDLFERCAHRLGLSLSAWMRMSLLDQARQREKVKER
jgi:uncharacterized protein (DUF1778 family)